MNNVSLFNFQFMFTVITNSSKRTTMTPYANNNTVS